MENKEISSVRKITGELIVGCIFYGIIFGIVYSIIYSIISDIMLEKSLILTALIAIILQGITMFVICRCSIASTFKKRLIERSNVKTVMRNLMIFTVIICIISGAMNFANVEKTVEESINSNISLKISENYMKYIYDEDEIAEYEATKEKVISETKTKMYSYLAVLEIGLLGVYVLAVLLQKRAILKYSV